MWAVDPGSALFKEPNSEEDEPVEDRRSSASFLRSLGGDDIDDLLNPKAAPALPPSLATNISTSRTPKKEVERYFSPAPAAGCIPQRVGPCLLPLRQSRAPRNALPA